MFFNILATFAEFEVDLLRLRTREGMAVARAKGKLSGKQPKLTARQQVCRAVIRTLARLTTLLGAKLGANVTGHLPTAGYVQPQLSQAVATPGNA
jgi:DNA invertase Pin-like site-specific DNA recombinase